MPHCSSLWLSYPTDLCFLRIPLCPPHQAAHIPMSRHFFVALAFPTLLATIAIALMMVPKESK
jgi:hypothetical protein